MEELASKRRGDLEAEGRPLTSLEEAVTVIRPDVTANHGRANGSLTVPIRRNGTSGSSAFRSRFAIDGHKIPAEGSMEAAYTHTGRHSWYCLKMLSSS